MKKSHHQSLRTRLGIEQIENRLMLSGDGVPGLDTDTFNLDPLGVGYAVISNDSAPQVTTTPITNFHTADFDGTTSAVDISTFRDEFVPQRDFLLDASGSLTIADGQSSPWRSSDDQAASLGDLRSRLDLLSDSKAGFAIGNQSYFIVVNGVGREFALVTTGVLHAGDSLDTRANFDSVLKSVIDADSLPHSGDLTSAPVGQPAAPLLGESGDSAAPVSKIDVTVRVDRQPAAGGAPSLEITIAAPPNTIIPIRQSDAQINVGQLIDELLTSGTNYVDQALPDDAGYDDLQLASSGGTTQGDDLFHAPLGRSDGQVAATGEVADEGGMVPVQGIVEALAGEAIAAPNTQQLVMAEAPAEISGELARAAVMELIEGETDPAAPQSVADHTFLVAADEAAFTPGQIAASLGGESPALFSAVRVIAGQAGQAASLVAPANPVYLAAMMSTAGDAFAAAAASAPLSAATLEQGPASDARQSAFSEWGEEDAADAQAWATDGANRWLNGAPLVVVLACERVLAAKRKRQQAAEQKATEQQAAEQEPPSAQRSPGARRRPK